MPLHMDHSETARLETGPHSSRKTVAGIQDAWTETDKAFRSGAIERMPSATLRIHLLTLANQPATAVEQRDVIRSMLLSHLLLQRQMERLDRRSSIYRWLASALAGVALLGSLIAIFMVATREPVVIQIPQPPVLQQQHQPGT